MKKENATERDFMNDMIISMAKLEERVEYLIKSLPAYEKAMLASLGALENKLDKALEGQDQKLKEQSKEISYLKEMATKIKAAAISLIAFGTFLGWVFDRTIGFFSK